MKIACCLDKNDKIVSINDWSALKIFEIDNFKTRQVQEIFSSRSSSDSLSDRRNFANYVLSSLGDCKILLASKITGIFYNLLESAGFELWEVDGDLSDILNSFIPMMDDTTPKNPSATQTGLLKKDEGILTFNLKEALIQFPDASSKKLLLPLLEETPFFQLNVLCGHIPPWFETTLKNMGFDYKAVELENKLVKAVIEKKVCSS
ncbi:Fe-only nitrogenase accessory AnfO family protein [Alkalibacter saccharofermentans]|uniref:Iron only nitrogenase protein AnfO (AnfO_nitrog) n=1 Tax=Alkalibacter saccharofermentans DSM 14828 TaxID=1120975 RepID=A0A1M4SC23_9FIRM|nr:Fe-only nitrogenase accessory AnfO family protein [Alkalibacter saccharofermentans]SHE29732.1 Iron only nitrogenase protein AnfO (AnfO_nitrog) [Alkalibacter saccharofermentans DSM 14828]